MALMYTTVIGYMVLLGISSYFTTYFLQRAVHSEDASVVDPKPEHDYRLNH
ncbi:hypothetical protein IRY55_12510 [Savagea sp. SN6]|uniref:Uncharacterized protein n=1 Tax=Savagea serpentis TaxID=2785297 RepID=A0A8J7KIA4_9BACL|nr:hypothetical protein [Savagea serpentis]MBF4502183.1 hypothetical protein [Savagea serpentis]